VAKGTVDPAVISDASQSSLKPGVADLSVLSDEPYEVEAELICRYSDARSSGPGAKLESNKVYLAPGDGRTNLVLTIPATACPVIPGKTLENDQ
jgi:hypothetical protein